MAIHQKVREAFSVRVGHALEGDDKLPSLIAADHFHLISKITATFCINDSDSENNEKDSSVSTFALSTKGSSDERQDWH